MKNPYAKMIDDAIQAHADLEVDLPTGPPHYLFSSREEFRRVLERVVARSGETLPATARDFAEAVSGLAFSLMCSRRILGPTVMTEQRILDAAPWRFKRARVCPSGCQPGDQGTYHRQGKPADRR